MGRTADPNRLRVIDPAVIAHVMQHPARRRPWSTRELAAVLGCGHAMIGHIRSGKRDTVAPDFAERFALAVGCEVPVLFSPSTETEDAA